MVPSPLILGFAALEFMGYKSFNLKLIRLGPVLAKWYYGLCGI